MEETRSTSIRSTKTLILLSIVLTVLSGMVVTVSADDLPLIPNQFYGTVTINGTDAPAGTIITAYIDGESRGSVVTTTAGKYGDDLNYLTVNGYESDDNKPIVFRINGVVADETDTYKIGSSPRIRDLSVSDYEVPVVMNPYANPESIVADGVQESRLNVTVISRCGTGNVTVTVNLSAIGRPGAQAMERISDDVYSTIVNVSEGTALGTYRLRVNASDVDEKYNDGVCIDLEVTAAGLPKTGDIDGSGGDVNFDDAIYLSRYTIFGESQYPLCADGDVDSSGDVNFDDAIYLSRYTIFGESQYPLYP